MRDVIATRFQQFDQPGSMGVVTDTCFIRCFWPQLDKPTALFADGSSGLQIIGPPTPRNVVFPADTVFPDYFPDAIYPAELAVQAVRGGKKFINLTDEECILWRQAYEKAASELHKTAAVHTTRSDCFVLRHFEKEGKVTTQYVAEITKQEADDIVTGKSDVADLKAAKEFTSIEDGKAGYTLDDTGKMIAAAEVAVP